VLPEVVNQEQSGLDVIVVAHAVDGQGDLHTRPPCRARYA
jgi:hypothetical protein